MYKDELIPTTRVSQVQVEDHNDFDNSINDETSIKWAYLVC